MWKIIRCQVVHLAERFFQHGSNHTIDGTFCDPYYGGNQNFVGWDTISCPRIRLGASEADVAAGAKLEPNHQSATIMTPTQRWQVTNTRSAKEEWRCLRTLQKLM